MLTSFCRLSTATPNWVDGVRYLLPGARVLVSKIHDDPARDEFVVCTVPVINMSGNMLFFLFLFAEVILEASPKTFLTLLSRELPLWDIPASFSDLDVIPVIV